MLWRFTRCAANRGAHSAKRVLAPLLVRIWLRPLPPKSPRGSPGSDPIRTACPSALRSVTSAAVRPRGLTDGGAERRNRRASAPKTAPSRVESGQLDGTALAASPGAYPDRAVSVAEWR